MKKKYSIEKAKKEDILGIYSLLHKEFIKKNSLNSEKFELEKHKKWYEFWIKSPYYHIYILKDFQEEIVGQIRFELDGEVAIINVYIKKEERHKGLGNEFVKESIAQVEEENRKLKVVLAYILEENENSKKMFESLDFNIGKSTDYKGIEHRVYTKKINFI